MTDPTPNVITISHDDVVCTITTPAPVTSEAYPIIKELFEAVYNTAIQLSLLMAPPEDESGD